MYSRTHYPVHREIVISQARGNRACLPAGTAHPSYYNSQDVVPFFGAVLPLGRENVIDVGATWQKKEKIDRCGVWVSETLPLVAPYKKKWDFSFFGPPP
jgi:hypothetical protein